MPLAGDRDREREGKPGRECRKKSKTQKKNKREKERLSTSSPGFCSNISTAFIRITGGRAGFDPVLRWEREKLYCTFFNISQLDQNNTLCVRTHRMYAPKDPALLGTHPVFKALPNVLQRPDMESRCAESPWPADLFFFFSVFLAPDLDQQESLLSNKL